ncbi:hypothetical protein GF327_08440 [Candidatus Woesearchaeota archaeon]|nr:hypothetical protein [Candidatus Woesearchaeota archaeon]
MEDIINAIQSAVISLDKEATKNHKEKLNFDSVNIHTGRSSPLSSFFEKELSKELSQVFPNYHIHIDYPLRLLNYKKEKLKKDGVKRSQAIYPDIMIVKLNKDKKTRLLKAIIEIKLDLGHLDLKSDRIKQKENLLKKASYGIFNTIVGAYSKLEQNKNRIINVTIPKSLKKNFIVVTKSNQHKHKGKLKSKSFLNKMEKYGYKVIFILDENIHFNTLENNQKAIKKRVKLLESEIKSAFSGI